MGPITGKDGEIVKRPLHVRHQQAGTAADGTAGNGDDGARFKSCRHEIVTIARPLQGQENVTLLQGAAIEIDTLGVGCAAVARADKGAAGGLRQFAESPERGRHLTHESETGKNRIEPGSRD